MPNVLFLLSGLVWPHSIVSDKCLESHLCMLTVLLLSHCCWSGLCCADCICFVVYGVFVLSNPSNGCVVVVLPDPSIGYVKFCEITS